VLTSVAPAGAAIGGTGSATNYTSGTTLSASSYTVVASATDGTAAGVRFYVDLTNLNGTTSTADGLQTGETLTVTVIGKTATSADVSDLALHRLSATINHTTGAVTYNSEANNNSSTAEVGSTLSITSATSNAASPNGSWSATGTKNNEVNRYWFGLVPDSNKALGAGAYTVRVRLNNANNVVIDKTLTVTWVPTIADAGATLTLANSGTIRTGAAYSYTSNGYTSATLKDANGGRVVLGLSGIASGTDASTTPSLDAAVVSSAGTVTESTGWAAADTGADGTDYAAGTGTEPTAGTCGVGGDSTCISLANSEIIANRANGVYGITDSSVSNAASNTSSIRVRVLNTAVSATVAVIIAPTNSSQAKETKVLATAAGLKASDTVAKATSSSTCTTACAISYNVPTTTSSVSLEIDTDAAGGSAISSNVTWSGNYASANVTPASDTTVVNYVDASGKFTVTLENKSAVNGAAADVVLTGFGSATDKVTVTVNWQTPVVTSVTVMDPVAGTYVKTKSTTTFSVLVQDHLVTPWLASN